jgi:hypothetical protein
MTMPLNERFTGYPQGGYQQGSYPQGGYAAQPGYQGGGNFSAGGGY